MTSYFDFVEELCYKALVADDWEQARRFIEAVYRCVRILHGAQHRLGGHLPIDVATLRRAVEPLVGDENRRPEEEDP